MVIIGTRGGREFGDGQSGGGRNTDCEDEGEGPHVMTSRAIASMRVGTAVGTPTSNNAQTNVHTALAPHTVDFDLNLKYT